MRTRTSQLLVSSLIVTLWVAAPLYSAVHLALEKHSYCAEHGALEEAGAVSASAVPESSTPLLADATGTATHSVCAFDSLATLESCDVLETPLPGVASMADAAVTAPHERTVRRAVALLRLAPKSSPPVIA